MNENWKVVLATPEEIQARLAKDVLKQNQIESLIVDKKDHITNAIGDYELEVPTEKAEKAMEVLKEAGF